MTVPASRFHYLEVSREGMHIKATLNNAGKRFFSGGSYKIERIDCTTGELIAAFKADCYDRKRKFSVTLQSNQGFSLIIKLKATGRYYVEAGEAGNGKHTAHATLEDLISTVEKHIMFYLCGGDI